VRLGAADEGGLPQLVVIALLYAAVVAAALLRRRGSIVMNRRQKRLVFRYFPGVGLVPLPRVRELDIEGVSGVALESRDSRYRIVLSYANGSVRPLLDEFTYDRDDQERVAAER